MYANGMFGDGLDFFSSNIHTYDREQHLGHCMLSTSNYTAAVKAYRSDNVLEARLSLLYCFSRRFFINSLASLSRLLIDCDCKAGLGVAHHDSKSTTM